MTPSQAREATQTAIAALSPRDARTYAWLMAASARLETRGDPTLALEARLEAGLLLVTPAPATRDYGCCETRRYCDNCQTHVKSASRIQLYEELGVDWVLCSKCGRSTDANK